MYLIDTSVWIDFLRGTQTSSVKRLSHILEREIPFGITAMLKLLLSMVWCFCIQTKTAQELPNMS